MLPEPITMNIPLQTDSTGTIRVSGTRVTLDTVIGRYLLGDSPEAIHHSFDVLPLNDIYAVISYYLANRDALDAYLKRRAEEARRLRDEIEASYTSEQRERNALLRARMDEMRRAQDK